MNYLEIPCVKKQIKNENLIIYFRANKYIFYYFLLHLILLILDFTFVEIAVMNNEYTGTYFEFLFFIFILFYKEVNA